MHKRSVTTLASIALGLLQPAAALASAATPGLPDLSDSAAGHACVVLFVIAYALVISEEWTGLRKSIPVLLAAGMIWIAIAWALTGLGQHERAGELVSHSLLEYGELLLFLLVAMTYINTLEERNVFDALHAWLVLRGYSLRTVFWLTGLLAFFISPVADNMTTALVMSSVAIAVGQRQPRFVVLACISIVVAANAGGAWSPFGDITTLMVWQKGKLQAAEFLALFLPSLVNWLVPAAFMSLAVPREVPEVLGGRIGIKRGGVVVILLFVGTIALTVALHSLLHLPPVLGMMIGMGALKLFGSHLTRVERQQLCLADRGPLLPDTTAPDRSTGPFNIFQQIARAEWDTLLFFYGIILCVGGLGTLGYLALGSSYLYGQLGATTANVLIGLVSAVVDNIPVMYAVLTMDPKMGDGQWLLVTLTAGVGGSLLSIGSAAGVAVMGQAHGVYTFFAHLRWSWAIALGYAASIITHLWINGGSFLRVHAG